MPELPLSHSKRSVRSSRSAKNGPSATGDAGRSTPIETDAGVHGIGECHHDITGRGAKDAVLNAFPQMLIEALHRGQLKFAVEIAVELRDPRLVRHDELLCKLSFTAVLRARRARDNLDMTVPIGIVSVAAIS